MKQMCPYCFLLEDEIWGKPYIYCYRAAEPTRVGSFSEYSNLLFTSRQIMVHYVSPLICKKCVQIIVDLEKCLSPIKE